MKHIGYLLLLIILIYLSFGIVTVWSINTLAGHEVLPLDIQTVGAAGVLWLLLRFVVMNQKANA